MGDSMPYSIILLSFSFLLSATVFSAELETQLKKVSVINKITSSTNDSEDSKKAIMSFKEYLQKQNSPVNPNEEARLFYETNVDSKPCSHCPKYLNLTLAVNKIVEKAKTDKDVALENETFIQLNKLKFLYYIVRTETEDGTIKCQKLGETQIQPTKLDGNFKMLSETIIKLSDVTDFQYIPKGENDIYYYYRGEGNNANIIIEVKMNKDGSSRLRYYEYAAADGSTDYLKQLQFQKKAEAEKKPEKPKDNYLNLGMDVKTKDSVIPEEITFLKAGAKTQLIDDVNMTIKHESGINEQHGSIALEKNDGSKWLLIEGKNITDGGKSLKTLIPVEVNLDKESALKVNASFENRVATDSIDAAKKGNFTTAQTIKLGLTDHNNEYVNVKAEVDQQGLNNYSINNKYSIGKDSSIGGAVQIDRDGKKSFSVNNVANFNDYGKFTTSFGTTESKKYIETKYENKISERTSLVIGAKLSEQTSVSLIFQSKF
jgi:hypothetical protein